MVRTKNIWCNEEQKLIESVYKEDYLKVVEELKILKETHVEYVEKKVDDKIKFEKELKEKEIEKNNIESNLQRVQNHLQSKAIECKEKDEEIKRLKENNEVLLNLLKGGEVKEELWVLEYVYKDNLGNRKDVILDPQPLEEIHEIVGMDCDNWIRWTIEKGY